MDGCCLCSGPRNLDRLANGATLKDEQVVGRQSERHRVTEWLTQDAGGRVASASRPPRHVSKWACLVVRPTVRKGTLIATKPLFKMSSRFMATSHEQLGMLHTAESLCPCLSHRLLSLNYLSRYQQWVARKWGKAGTGRSGWRANGRGGRRTNLCSGCGCNRLYMDMDANPMLFHSFAKWLFAFKCLPQVMSLLFLLLCSFKHYP